MVLIDSKWNQSQRAIERTYLANTQADVSIPDDDSAAGSTILVIGTGAVWMKNENGQWQKVGTEEVLA